MRIRFRSRRRARQGSSGFALQDVGDAGWEFLSLAPTPSVGLTAAERLHKDTNTGSRLYFIDPDKPIATTELAADQDGRIYFHDGTNIIDEDGSTTNPSNSLAYGTDPKNPNMAAIRAFRRWAYVGPRSVADGDIGTAKTCGGYTIALFRSGFPDWWLFKRGSVCDLYRDARSFYDDVGRSGDPVQANTVAVRAASGRSATERAVVGAYGPSSDGRAEFRHPNSNFFGASGSTPCKFSTYFGLRYNGAVRNPALRPVDWGRAGNDIELGCYTLGLNGNFEDVLFEDIHADQLYGGFGFQWDQEFVSPVVSAGLRENRLIISDSWDEEPKKKGDARRATGDADQSWAAGTTTKLTFVTAGPGNTAIMDAATGTLTAPAPESGTTGTWYKAWYLLDVKATVPVGGSIEVLLFRNGAEVVDAFESQVIPGTGVTDDVYALHGKLYAPKCAAGDTLDVRIRTTDATGTVTVLGGFAKLQFDAVLNGGSNGSYINASEGTKVNFKQVLYLRNGFNVSPQMDLGVPDGVRRRNWDIRNHNMYFNGTSKAGNFVVKDCVSILGAAGDTSRALMDFSECFIYGGYLDSTPHHPEPGGFYNDNVLQRYESQFGDSTAHPGWGIGIGNGTSGFEIKRNIISSVVVDLMGVSGAFYGIRVAGQSTPYLMPSPILWTGDTTNTTISGNILDCPSGGTNTSLIEVNGGAFSIVQWQAPITGTLAVGGTVTCTPTAGWASGTPTYQWQTARVLGNSGTDISGATSATHVLRDLARTHRGTVANQAAMLALSSAVEGDVCYRSDTNVLWELRGADPTIVAPSSTTDGWLPYTMRFAGAHANRGRVADETAMLALSSPVNGDYCLREDLATWHEVSSSTWRALPQKTYLDLYTTTNAGSYAVTTYHMLICIVGGIVYPQGVGINGTSFTGNTLIKPAADAVEYYTTTTYITNPTAPTTSGAVVSGNTEYLTRATAAAALGWSNPDASLKTYLQSLGATVESIDGAGEFCALVMGDDPTRTAMRYGQWDGRLNGREIGNHVRAGRGMAVVA